MLIISHRSWIFLYSHISAGISISLMLKQFLIPCCIVVSTYIINGARAGIQSSQLCIQNPCQILSENLKSAIEVRLITINFLRQSTEISPGFKLFRNTDAKEMIVDFHRQKESRILIALSVAFTANIDSIDNASSLVKCISKEALPNLSMWIQEKIER